MRDPLLIPRWYVWLLGIVLLAWLLAMPILVGWLHARLARNEALDATQDQALRLNIKWTDGIDRYLKEKDSEYGKP